MESVFLSSRIYRIRKKNFYSDVRVLVSNHKIVSAMERISKNYITNVFKGAECKKKLISLELKKFDNKNFKTI